MDVSCSDLRITIPPGKPDQPRPGRQTSNRPIGSKVPADAAKTQSASRSSAMRMRRLASPHSINTAATAPSDRRKSLVNDDCKLCF
jgi:hypothetical protein